MFTSRSELFRNCELFVQLFWPDFVRNDITLVRSSISLELLFGELFPKQFIVYTLLQKLKVKQLLLESPGVNNV